MGHITITVSAIGMLDPCFKHDTFQQVPQSYASQKGGIDLRSPIRDYGETDTKVNFAFSNSAHPHITWE